MKTKSYISLFAVVLALLGAGSANAAGLLTPKGQSSSLNIRDHRVNVVVEDGYVVTEIDQVFINTGGSDVEAVYSFPVPSHAAVAEFTYWIDGQPVTGEVLEKEKAREIYEEEKQAAKETEDEYAGLVKRMQDVLGERVNSVRVSQRLTDSPSCLVMGEHDMAVHMQQMLKQAGHEVPPSKPDLEINPSHTLVSRLKDEADDDRFASWSNVLLDQAMLSEGGQLDDPVAFVNRLNDLLLEMTKPA